MKTKVNLPEEPENLLRRRTAVVEFYRRYISETFHELGAASEEDTENLRMPLEAFARKRVNQLTVEEIQGWESFRHLASEQLRTARSLFHILIEKLTEARECISSDDMERLIANFQNPSINFKAKERFVMQELPRILRQQEEKKRHAEEAAKIVKERQEREEEHRREEENLRESKRAEKKRIEPTEGQVEKKPADEHEHHNRRKQAAAAADEERPEEKKSVNATEQLQRTLGQIPSSLRMLYIQSIGEGPATLNALMTLMRNHVLTEERAIATGTCQPHYLKKEEQRTFMAELRQRRGDEEFCRHALIPEGIPFTTQKYIVEHLHPSLNKQLLALVRTRTSNGL